MPRFAGPITMDKHGRILETAKGDCIGANGLLGAAEI
jgi:hypothetical protein